MNGEIPISPPIIDLYVIATKYGLFIFGTFYSKHVDPFRKRKDLLHRSLPLKNAFFVPWRGVVAWELIDIDDPRRIVLLADTVFHHKHGLIETLLLKLSRISIKRKELILGFPIWFTILENPLVFRSRVFDEIVGYLRRYAGDKEVKGLEKNGSYVLVKKELEKTEIIDVVHKKPEEIWGVKKKFALKDLLKIGLSLALGMPVSIPDRYVVIDLESIDLLKVGKKLGFKGFDLYLTDRGIALLPDVPELDLPHDRVYWELDKNHPLIQKWSNILGVKPSALRKIASLYRFIRVVNLRAGVSRFWGLFCEDTTTPQTHKATKRMIEKIKKGEIKELVYIEPDGDRKFADEIESTEVLVTLFWDPGYAPSLTVLYVDGVYRNEEGLECCSITGFTSGSGIIEFLFPEPVKNAEELKKFKHLVYELFSLKLDEETMEILNKIYYKNEIPEQIADKIHSEYERITKEAPKAVKEIRKMGPKKNLPLLYYIY